MPSLVGKGLLHAHIVLWKARSGKVVMRPTAVTVPIAGSGTCV
jgi:hypothetical protein